MSLGTANDQWVDRLQSDGVEQEQAIAELRAILLRGVASFFSTHDDAQPEDIVQDALVRILDSLEKFEGRSKFTSWAMTIATRIGISQRRRKHFQDVSLSDFEHDSLGTGFAQATEAMADNAAEKKAILEYLDDLIESELTEKQRLVIRVLLEGVPVEEIAQRMGSNRNAIYKLAHDARMKIRQGFERADIQAQDIDVIFS